MVPLEEDPWATKEFYVKWKRWSYIHCSWDSRETLCQLGGYKRVMNYMKRQDALELAKRSMAPEEVGLLYSFLDHRTTLAHQSSCSTDTGYFT